MGQPGESGGKKCGDLSGIYIRYYEKAISFKGHRLSGYIRGVVVQVDLFDRARVQVGKLCQCLEVKVLKVKGVCFLATNENI